MITLSQNLVQNVAGDPVADVCLGHDTRFQVHGDKLTELLDGINVIVVAVGLFAVGIAGAYLGFLALPQ